MQGNMNGSGGLNRQIRNNPSEPILGDLNDAVPAAHAQLAQHDRHAPHSIGQIVPTECGERVALLLAGPQRAARAVSANPIEKHLGNGTRGHESPDLFNGK